MRNRNELFIVIATVAILACMVFSVLGIGTGCSDRSTASIEEEEDDDDDAPKKKRTLATPLEKDENIAPKKETKRFVTAKEKANQAECTNRLKQIGLASWQYAASYDDWYPTSSFTTRPKWMNADSGNSLELLRSMEFLTDPKGYLCPSKEGVTAAQPNRSIRGHVSYNWCDGNMDGNSGMSPIACDGTDNHPDSGRYLMGDGSVRTAKNTDEAKWTQDPSFKNACYDKTYADFSF